MFRPCNSNFYCWGGRFSREFLRNEFYVIQHTFFRGIFLGVFFS